MVTTPLRAALIAAGSLRAMALDAAAGVLGAAEAAGDALAGRTPALASLRVAVTILSDETGPLAAPDDVAGALAAADRVFTVGAGVRIRPVGIDVIAEPAPAAVLDPRANRRLLLDHLIGRTAFLDRQLPRRPLGSVIGDPVTVVVCRRIAGTVTGCSLGMTADWVFVQADQFDRSRPAVCDETVLAHELGHALNLPHVRDQSNLMAPVSTPPDRRRGTRLQKWQRALIRANRHVIPPAAAPRARGQIG